MGAWMHKHALTSTPTSLFVNMCAAFEVGMVHSGTKQEALDKEAAADSAHRSKRAKKLHEEKDALGKIVLTVKMGNKSHEKKDADV
jgi:hypothetical protein